MISNIEITKERLKECIEQAKLSYMDLEKLTNFSKSSIQRYVSGATQKIPVDFIEVVAKALNVSAAYLMGWESEDNKHKGVMIPVLGYVRAGIPMTAVENIIDYEEITPEMSRQGEFFGLQIKGDSMEPRMCEGDVVIVKKQDFIENGSIAVVLVNNDDATIKYFEDTGKGIKLIPTNPNYIPLFYTPQEVEQLPVKVIGKVVELRAKFN